MSIAKINQKRMDNKGFTLIELVIVIAIMAILIAILAPQYMKYVDRSKVAADATIQDEINNAVNVALTDDTYSDKITTSFTVTWTNKSIVVASTDDTTKGKVEEALKEYIGADAVSTTTAPAIKSKAHQAAASDTFKITVTVDANGVATSDHGVWQ